MKNNNKKSENDNPVLRKINRLGVIIENVDSKVDLLVEGHGSLDKKIEDFRGEVNEKFREVDYKFGVVIDELRVIRNELKEKVGRDEFVVLEKRVAFLEKKLTHSSRPR